MFCRAIVEGFAAQRRFPEKGFAESWDCDAGMRELSGLQPRRAAKKKSGVELHAV